MNIFDAVYAANKNRLNKEAMSVKTDKGERRSYTYKEMLSRASEYAEKLASSGVRAGDRIAFVSEGCLEWTIAFLACCKMNCTGALIDASLTAAEIDEFVVRSDVRAAFFSEKSISKFKVKPDYKFPVFNILDCSVFEGFEAGVSPELPATSDPDETIATIIFSSGTTRKAAGIMHTHDNLIETTKMTLDVQKITHKDRFLAIIPNSHIYGVICLMLGPALAGAGVHYIGSLSADAIMGAFSEYRPTVLPAVPKVYELFMMQIMKKIKSSKITETMFKVFFPICLKKRKKNGSLLGKKLFKSIHDGFGGSLNFLCSAGAPMNRDVAEFYYGTGFNLLITYGASETNIPTIGNRPDDIHTDSCGTPYPAVAVKLSDTGEILIKSPYMMKGYFRDEEATKEAFTEDGWFLTGDLGEQDEHGNIRITGRSKENIVLASGKKIAPDDVEEKYSALRGVKEFVICGVPNENTNYDEIHAFVVAEGITKEDKEAILQEIREKGAQLIQNMRISKTHFVNEIPRTSLQKPKRYLLKQQALAEKNGEINETAEAKEDSCERRVKEIISKIANASADDISGDTKIFKELSLDSISSISLAMDIEEAFKVNIEEYFSPDMTVGDIVGILENGADKRDHKEQKAFNYPLNKTNGDYYTYASMRNLAQFCYKMRVHGKEKLPEDKGFIICANHVSKIDYLYITSAFSKERYKKTCCMAKKELFRDDPFSHKLIKTAGMVPVDRTGINMQTMTSLESKLHDNWCVVIHPEGTRSEDGIFRGMKNGAATLAVDARVPIVPAYINGAYEVFPKGKKMMKIFDWKHMKKFPIDVSFGEPISSDGKTADELSNEVANAILKMQSEYKDIKETANL